MIYASTRLFVNPAVADPMTRWMQGGSATAAQAPESTPTAESRSSETLTTQERPPSQESSLVPETKPTKAGWNLFASPSAAVQPSMAGTTPQAATVEVSPIAHPPPASLSRSPTVIPETLIPSFTPEARGISATGAAPPSVPSVTHATVQDAASSYGSANSAAQPQPARKGVLKRILYADSDEEEDVEREEREKKKAKRAEETTRQETEAEMVRKRRAEVERKEGERRRKMEEEEEQLMKRREEEIERKRKQEEEEAQREESGKRRKVAEEARKEEEMTRRRKDAEAARNGDQSAKKRHPSEKDGEFSDWDIDDLDEVERKAVLETSQVGGEAAAGGDDGRERSRRDSAAPKIEAVAENDDDDDDGNGHAATPAPIKVEIPSQAIANEAGRSEEGWIAKPVKSRAQGRMNGTHDDDFGSAAATGMVLEERVLVVRRPRVTTAAARQTAADMAAGGGGAAAGSRRNFKRFKRSARRTFVPVSRFVRPKRCHFVGIGNCFPTWNDSFSFSFSIDFPS